MVGSLVVGLAIGVLVFVYQGTRMKAKERRRKAARATRENRSA